MKQPLAHHRTSSASRQVQSPSSSYDTESATPEDAKLPEQLVSETPRSSRRDALRIMTGTMAASLLLSVQSPSFFLPEAIADEDNSTPSSSSSKKNIIITGANSGIGLSGATKLAAEGNRVFLACRTLEKANQAKAAIESIIPANGGEVIAMQCDLASLASIRTFVDTWHDQGYPLDVLVCNAGLQYSGEKSVRRTTDGFEVTVGTNHLGHFLLTNLLLPDLEKTGQGARIVITASEVHDPESPGGSVGDGATLGQLKGFEADGRSFEMVDGLEYNSDKAYKDSKLCNVLFAAELQRRLTASGSPVTVNAFGPGLITRTGFFRYQKPVFVKVFDFFANDIFKVAETVEGGGECLRFMVSDESLDGKSGLYYNNEITGYGKHTLTQIDPSVEARDVQEAEKLWRLSADLVGLTTV
eukprot:CAMPEP_0197867234 /NCGR_PEP_ID=MMETSP1438-20131217/44648_1 /TAXON_ID=1461541 /ORGANISM="Pterosperma sp., Strain CCMP1384" /LENGTH=413 /DNA_ID=CAMNT_0043485869 /DNA_START=123 /DNA_END=1364 /DNA_ORIENTATION=-